MRVQLLGGSYKARGYIASAQRCVNLYPENAPQQEQTETPVTHYPAPGSGIIIQLPETGAVTGLYATSRGDFAFATINNSLYVISDLATATKIGEISGGTQVKFSDNGIYCMAVDGSSNGYIINMLTNTMITMSAANASGINGYGFRGANYVDFVDSFLVGNILNSDQWFSSGSNQFSVDSLAFAAKSGSPDLIRGVAALRRYVWLIGEYATELWFTSGGTQFPFSIVPGPYIEHGTCAQYSICKIGEAVLWLSRDRQGDAIVLMGEGYAAQRVSNFAVEQEISTYTLEDAIGMGYQQQGHTFYLLTFPTSDKTWCYDLTTGEWHERVWVDTNGQEHRHRANCMCHFQGVVLMGDFEDGSIRFISPTLATDNGMPMLFKRGFPGLNQELRRTTHWLFMADVETGRPGAPFTPPLWLGTDGLPSTPYLFGDGPVEALLLAGGRQLTAGTSPADIWLRWSDDRGATWGNPIRQTLGEAGETSKTVQWRRLGQARDRVYELYWTAPVLTALNGAIVDPRPGSS